jgi:hypothetical protein
MASGKKRQTFEKMNRERRVREKRALKAEKREQRKLEANAVAQDPAAGGDEVVEPRPDDSPADERA